MKVCLLTNIPVPYREEMYNILSEAFGCDFTVIYCAEKEFNRKWIFPYGKYKKIFLSKGESQVEVYSQLEIISVLKDLSPDVVITTGFYPTMIYAFLWTLISRKLHIVFTDGTLQSEKKLSPIHILARKIFFIKTKAFICTSNGGYELYRSYNIKKDCIFRSYLSVDNARFFSYNGPEAKTYDLMFSGQMIERKMPFFFAEVARLVKKKNGFCKVLIIGEGPLKDKFLKKIEEYKIDYYYPGFVNQEDLPKYYKMAKLFLFPTQNDPWGVVVNEAMAAGLPVITCKNAGVADDLVVHEENGYVLPLCSNSWADTISRILQDDNYYMSLSKRATDRVKNYNSLSAAKAFIDATNFLTKNE